MDKNLETYIDAKQIAQCLGISRSGIFNLTRDGRFPTGIKIGKSRRWRLDEVKAWLEAKERRS